MSGFNDVYAIITGDGCVTKRGEIYIIHSIKQKDWLIYKAGLLEANGFKVKVWETDKKSYGAIRPFIVVQTTATSIGKDLRKMFYPNDIKLFPKNIELNAHQLSILYQDDGRQNVISHYNTKCGSIRSRVETDPFVNRYELCKNNLDMYSITNLQNCLNYFGVETSVQLKKKQNNQPIICVTRKKSKETFFSLISPYIVNCMRYKISATPSLTYYTVRD